MTYFCVNIFSTILNKSQFKKKFSWRGSREADYCLQLSQKQNSSKATSIVSVLIRSQAVFIKCEQDQSHKTLFWKKTTFHIVCRMKNSEFICFCWPTQIAHIALYFHQQSTPRYMFSKRKKNNFSHKCTSYSVQGCFCYFCHSYMPLRALIKGMSSVKYKIKLSTLLLPYPDMLAKLASVWRYDIKNNVIYSCCEEQTFELN